MNPRVFLHTPLLPLPVMAPHLSSDTCRSTPRDQASLPPSHSLRQDTGLYFMVYFHSVTMCFSSVYKVKWKQSHT